MADRDGLAALSMRRLGSELNVEAMSLYNHVRDKRDLLEGVLDLVLGGCAAEVASEDAQGAATQLAGAVRAALLRHPNVAPLVATRPRETIGIPALRSIRTKAYEVATRLDVSGSKVPYMLGILLSFVVGHVLLETGQFPVGPPAPAPAGPIYDADRSFELGLRSLLVGLFEGAG